MTTVGKTPLKTVLTPRVLAGAFWEDDCQWLLQAWKQGAIHTLCSPPLLTVYLQLLKSLGLSDRHLKWWAWWFSASNQSEFLAIEAKPGSRALELCRFLADTRAGAVIVHLPPRPTDDAGHRDAIVDHERWVTPSELKDRLVGGRNAGG